MAIEFELKAGQLAKRVNKHKSNPDRKVDNIKINEFRKHGVIPSFLVDEQKEQRRYDEDAVEWVVLALRIKRYGEATYEKIGKIYSVAIAQWEATQTTLEKLKICFDTNKNYPDFVQALLDMNLELSEDVAKDAPSKSKPEDREE